MNPKLKIVCILSVLTVGLISFALAKTFWFERPSIPHSLNLSDWSGSTPGDCESVIALSRQSMKLPQMRRGSTMTVAVTGDETTANEPRTLGAYTLPISDKAFEGAKLINEKQNEMLTEIKGKCGRVPSAKKSSIFLGLKSGVEQLKSVGCNEKADCTIFVKSDLQENIELQIKSAIDGNKASLSKLPAPIDNRGIRITICGIAETKGLTKEPNGKSRQMTENRNAARFDLIRQIWSQLFTQPELVTFSSFCSN